MVFDLSAKASKSFVRPQCPTTNSFDMKHKIAFFARESRRATTSSAFIFQAVDGRVRELETSHLLSHASQWGSTLIMEVES